MQDNRRWILISLFLFGITVGYVSFLLFRNINVMFRLATYFPFAEVLVKALPVVLGVGIFVWVYRSQSRMSYLDDVVGEIRKITWPTRKDTVASTIVVVIAILIIASILGVYDALCNWVIRQII